MVLKSISGETAWAECESVIRRFEDAWHDDGRPDVGDYVPSDSPHSARLLVELVHIDLEFRLRAGDFARAEDYLARFPQLSAADLARDLILAESALRNRHGTAAWPEEFWLRFPEYADELRRRLAADDGTDGYAATRPAERPGAPLSGPPVIPGYEIQGELGRGGMGVVYKARDLLLLRTVAVKTFATVPRPESCARFAREAEAIARLDHPNIVPVYEVGAWHAADGGPTVPFFVMKWYPGGNMDAAPAGPGTDTAAHARAVETIARAVHHAHQRGVLHRDLKPSNILLDDAGRPHVADFGLAGRVHVDPDARTVTAAIVGTPAYMAPEQARSPKQVSTAADVYGLGAILYHRLTGRAPFTAETPLATLDLVTSAPAKRPSTVNPAVPRDLDTICLKCLDKDPGRRYASAAEVADDLERWRKGHPIAARPARAWELAYRRARRHPVATALACTTVAALVGAIAVLSVANDRISEKEKETKAAYLRECAMRYKLEEALARDAATRGQLEVMLRREQRALYLERIVAAARLYAANQLTEAWTLLDQCPEPYRGWEWRYLDSLRHLKTVVLEGHATFVTKVACLPDGRMISGDVHGVVRTWDVANERAERTWPFSRTAIGALATHPKKNWVALADTHSVTVWNVDTGRMVAKLAGLGWVAFSPDGTLAATADKSTVRLWAVPVDEPKAGAEDGPPDAPTWKSVGELTGHQEALTAGVFTPDGKQLVTGSADRTIRTWDLETRKQIGSRAVPTPVTALAVAREGKVLAEAHFGAVVFTDLATGEMRDRLAYLTGERTVVASGPDQRTVAAGGANGEVIVWDAVRRRTVRVFRGHAGRVAALAFGPGDRLASCGSDQTVRLWDLNRERDVRTLAWEGEGGGVAVSPDGKTVAVRGPTTGQNEPAVVILDAATGHELHRVPGGPDSGFNPTNGRLVAVRPSGLALWDLAIGSEVWNRPFAKPGDSGTPAGRRMALSRDGSRLAVWVTGAVGVQLWNPADGTSLGTIDTGKAVVSEIAFSPDGSRLVVAAPDTVAMWDVQTRTRLSWGEGAPGAVAVAFGTDGRWIATVENDHTVRLRDAVTGREVRPFGGAVRRVNALCFSPDGTRLLTGGADRTVRVWDVETGRELLSLPGVTGAVSGLAWDDKNDRVYAIDHAVRVWGPR